MRPDWKGPPQAGCASNGAGRDPRNPVKPFHVNFLLAKKNGSPHLELPSILKFKKIQVFSSAAMSLAAR